MKNQQRTIARSVEFSGCGLQTGEPATMRLNPAPVDHGVVFVRTDLPGKPRIPANVKTIAIRLRRTCVSDKGVEVQTIEHLLSCLAALRIDNLEVEISGPEVPAADGSALPFWELLKSAGTKELDAPRRQIRIARPIYVEEGDLSLVVLPAENGLRVSYTFDWWSEYGEIDDTCPVFAPQYFTVELTEESFEKEIAPARTFVAQVDAEKLRSLGLGRGATYDNTLVVGPEGVIQNELRYPDEFVRHKILDLVGDLFLLQGDIHCHIVAVKTGHALNMKMVEEIEKQAGDAEERWMDVRQIQRILPHRFPFLMVDRVLEVEDGKRCLAVKNVTINEPYFQGHFPNIPVMPGVMQIEAMAQVAGLMLVKQLTQKNKLAMLLSLDKVKLRKAVVPGDQLLIEAVAVRIKERVGEVQTTASVDGRLVAEAQIRFMIVDADSL